MAPQIWRRLGLVFCTDGRDQTLATHATYPTPLLLGEDRVRVFFSPRDVLNRSSIYYLDLRLAGERFDILALSDRPLLTPGRRGAFDDSGVTVSCIIPDGNRLLVYYLGWSLGTTVPFRNFIGLATGSIGGGPLDRHSEAPLVERSAVDPFVLGYPWVIRDGDTWRMWYGSHLGWGDHGLEMIHVIKDGTSNDGISWQRTGHVAIPVAGEPEFAISRPCVLRDSDRYRMWYARRNPSYNLGYAESANGVDWTRRDDDLMFSGPLGAWESECTTYPAVFDCNGSRYLLYNGNGYGRTGFGLALLESR